MAKLSKTPLELGRRERQIYETLEKIGEGSVQQVLDGLEDPPKYSSVRTMLNVLVQKGWITFRKVGRRYIYRPSQNETKRRRSYFKQLLEVCFGGNPKLALVALLDFSASELSDDELNDLEAKIEAIRDRRGNK